MKPSTLGCIGVKLGRMEKKMETTIMGLYRDYRVYIGVILGYIWVVPKIRGTYLRVPIIRKDYSILGSILGSPYLGKLPYVMEQPVRIMVSGLHL